MPTKTNILIVEDEKDLAKSIRNHLADEGYEVSVADDGEKGIAFIKGKEFAVVVLDIKLPVINGLEVLAFIKKNSPATKVIITTGYADLTNKTKCMELGADRFVEKPYELEDLFDIIKQVVKQ